MFRNRAAAFVFFAALVLSPAGVFADEATDRVERLSALLREKDYNGAFQAMKAV